MESNARKWISFPPDWTWISVGFCYFVIGHLLPLSILSWMSSGDGMFQYITSVMSFAGLAVIAFIIGYRSRNIAVVETVIACLLYTFIMNVATSQMWNQSFRMAGPAWMMLAFVTSALSATMGEIVQSMKIKTVDN
jgi:hypothetical protein